MANVYLAVAQGLAGFNKLVVLKLLRQHLATDAETLEMFLHEARLAARLNHPNVVQTYEVGMEGGRHGLIMEYLEGQSLASIWNRAGKVLMPAAAAGQATSEVQPIGRKGFSLRMHLRVLVDALAGLQYAHELADYDGKKLGLVHRDVSPHNVFVTFEGQVKLLDFGIAKASVGHGDRTQTGIIKGKIQYMAPEQMAGDDVDRRADLFSVGVMLWEAATGKRLWKGVADVAIMNRVLNGDFPRPRDVRSEISPELERIIMKAMSVDRNNRHATAFELQAEIEAELAALGDVKAREVGAYVADLFADVRTDTRSLIEAQLSKALELPSAEYDALGPITLGRVPSLGGATVSSSDVKRKGDTPDGASLTTSTRPTRTWMFVAVGTIAVGGGLFVWRASGKEHPPVVAQEPGLPAATQPAAEVAPPVQVPPVPSPEMRIHVETDPPGAKLYLDGNELPSDPFDSIVPRDHAWHTLRAEARGRVPKDSHVSFDQDIWLSLKLDPVTQPGRPPTVPVAVKPSGAPAPTTACLPPYYIEDGIKKIKPGCM
jgi:serine/threonine-protein kinase